MDTSEVVRLAEMSWRQHKIGDYPGALFLLRKLAKDGDSDACAVIGIYHENGVPGIPRDYEQALNWYTKALRQPDQYLANFGLARMYYFGRGVKKNHQIALQHLQRIQNLPEPGVHYLLGLIYAKSRKPIRDFDKAEAHYKRATDAGHIAAKAALGRLMIWTGRIKAGLSLMLDAWGDIQYVDLDDWRVNIRLIWPDLHADTTDACEK